MSGINIFNRTGKEQAICIDGREFIFPAFGGLVVTPKKAAALLKECPEILSLQKAGTYTEDEIASLAKMDRNHLQEIATRFMKGEPVGSAELKLRTAAPEKLEIGKDEAKPKK